MPITIFEAAANNDVATLRTLLANDDVNIDAIYTEENGVVARVLANTFVYGKKTAGGAGVAFSTAAAVFLIATGLWGPALVAGLLFNGVSATAYRAGNDTLVGNYTYNRTGWTALHFAAAAGATDAAIFLIRKGADTTIEAGPSGNRKTFLRLAKDLHEYDPLFDNWSFTQKCEATVTQKLQEENIRLREERNTREEARGRENTQTRLQFENYDRRIADFERRIQEKDRRITDLLREQLLDRTSIRRLLQEKEALQNELGLVRGASTSSAGSTHRDIPRLPGSSCGRYPLFSSASGHSQQTPSTNRPGTC